MSQVLPSPSACLFERSMSALASTFKTIDEDNDTLLSPTSQHFFQTLKSEPPQQQPALEYIVGTFLDSLETLPVPSVAAEPVQYHENMLLLNTPTPAVSSHKRSYSEHLPTISIGGPRRFSLQTEPMVLPSPDPSPMAGFQGTLNPNDLSYMLPTYLQQPMPAMPYYAQNPYLESLPELTNDLESSELAPEENLLEKDDSETTSYTCTAPGCAKRFSKASSLKTHLASHHNGKPKPFSCAHCPQSFSRSHDLKRHMYIHSQDKPFVCPRCNRGFSRRDALRRHEKSVKEGKKVQCHPDMTFYGSQEE
ncbi:hypothetical protein EDD86DRAFT_201868 [Gorgonomyces haynaldii]|nr:hypothetical protein EDD86DRAFT_201868 [Gorgonomyces haynaldii]